jgi:16S rRNA C967 or C1407 C5-methylase (RsmB/RsmF family)
MPITKERLRAVVDESYEICGEYYLILDNILSYAGGQDAEAAIREIVIYVQQLKRPQPRIAYAEARLLKSTWGMNEWRKNRRAEERALKAYARVERVEREASSARERLAREQQEDKFEIAERLLQESEANVKAKRLTKDEWAKIAKPDDASALPAGMEVQFDHNIVKK